MLPAAAPAIMSANKIDKLMSWFWFSCSLFFVDLLDFVFTWLVFTSQNISDIVIKQVHVWVNLEQAFYLYV